MPTINKKQPKRKTSIKKTKRKSKKAPILKKGGGNPVGKVTHYYGGIKVAIVKFAKPVKKGTEIYFSGATTDFSQKIDSMQYDHKPISIAKKSQQVGIKAKKKVREGDEIFIIE